MLIALMRIAVVLSAPIWIAGCKYHEINNDNNVLVFAAASTTDALEELITQFQQETGLNVRVNFAGSSTLAQQIINGADADLFLSANLDWVTALADQNLVSKSRPLIGNRLVLIVSAESEFQPAKLQDLVDDRVKRISIADPASVPAGVYAKRALNELGIWEQVKPKLVFGVHVRQVLSQIENELVDVGIVYSTDARISESVKVTGSVKPELTGPIDYGLVLTSDGVSNPNAVKFFDALTSKSALTVFEKHGFTKGTADH